MSSMAKLEHYVYINGLLKDFNFCDCYADIMNFYTKLLF